jgi:hypothetical protein
MPMQRRARCNIKGCSNVSECADTGADLDLIGAGWKIILVQNDAAFRMQTPVGFSSVVLLCPEHADLIEVDGCNVNP